jgi:hypothetical protein
MPEVLEGPGMPEVSEGPGMPEVLEGKGKPEASGVEGTPKVSEINRETEVSGRTVLPEISAGPGGNEAPYLARMHEIFKVEAINEMSKAEGITKCRMGHNRQPYL